MELFCRRTDVCLFTGRLFCCGILLGELRGPVFYRLFAVVERQGERFVERGKIDFLQIHPLELTVVLGVIKEFPVRLIVGDGPDRRAAHSLRRGFAAAFSRAQRDIEIIENPECLVNAFFPFGSGRAVALNATARMKREGGVKSPGKPSIPLPPPRGDNLILPRSIS